MVRIGTRFGWGEVMSSAALKLEQSGSLGRPLHVVHIVFRFDYGGLENGLVNLINTMDPEVARHTVVALTDATGIVERIRRTDTEVIALHKRAGKDPAAYYRLFRLLRRLRPDVVHTRNIGTLDCQLVAWLAGVPTRVHGEHGWDTHDPYGLRRRYRWMRRLLFPIVHRVIALSKELEDWLRESTGLPAGRLVRICNGVDCQRFRPADRAIADSDAICFGTVTRFAPIKDPLNLLEAYRRLREHRPEAPSRLVMVGGGALLDEAREFVRHHGLEPYVTLAGEQPDVEPWLSGMDVYVQGSRREGISNTVLEAMAMGLPVVATHVGGNPELVEHGLTGELVPPEDSERLAEALARYLDDPPRIQRQGREARRRAESNFSLQAMTTRYTLLYTTLARSQGLVSV